MEESIVNKEEASTSPPRPIDYPSCSRYPVHGLLCFLGKEGKSTTHSTLLFLLPLFTEIIEGLAVKSRDKS